MRAAGQTLSCSFHLKPVEFKSDFYSFTLCFTQQLRNKDFGRVLLFVNITGLTQVSRWPTLFCPTRMKF